MKTASLNDPVGRDWLTPLFSLSLSFSPFDAPPTAPSLRQGIPLFVLLSRVCFVRTLFFFFFFLPLCMRLCLCLEACVRVGRWGTTKGHDCMLLRTHKG